MTGALLTQTHQPLPAPTGAYPYRLDLRDVVPPDVWTAIVESGRLIFHAAGDTGGLNLRDQQALVAREMSRQFGGDPAKNPAFFFHLGDVVYDHGSRAEYYRQFYHPYRDYPAPILAIPGNHDGDVDPFEEISASSLYGFLKAFCQSKKFVPEEAGETGRTTMIQPNVYFTLLTPFARIIAMYSNVPEFGVVLPEQRAWLAEELKAAGETGQAIIIALHNAPYSLDIGHGPSLEMQSMLKEAFHRSGVTPDLILSGHVHNYQRFTHRAAQKDIAFVVAGAGGYMNLHKVYGAEGKTTKVDAHTTLNAYNDDHHGFLKIEIDARARTLRGDYFIVPNGEENPNGPAVLFDSFVLPLKKSF